MIVPTTVPEVGALPLPLDPAAAARLDAARIVEIIDYVLPTFHDADSLIVVDGEHLSPSWRALKGGSMVWDLGCGEADAIYEDALDTILGCYEDEVRGGHVEWSSGCLVFFGCDFDGEAF